MQTYLDCIPCFIRQSLDAARQATDDKSIHEQVVREVLGMTTNLDMSQSPPKVAQKIHHLVRKLVNVKDPYCDAKRHYNAVAMQLYPKMREVITASEDPLETAVRLAIAGNIIDLGVKSQLMKIDISETINECLTNEFKDKQLDSFRTAVDNANEILYLTDNVGEIFFDKLLIEQLPYKKITVCVKGSPIINDATMEDAVLAGLPEIVKVIDNGSDAPGTILESCSENFKKHFEKADLIISKGQGNYETLSHINKNIFFILKVKCEIIARDMGCELGKMILQQTKSLRMQNKK